MRIQNSLLMTVFALSFAVVPFCNAQEAASDQKPAEASDQKPAEQKSAEQKPADPAPPAPLTTPAITGPLAQLPPALFDAGPFGKIAFNGIVNGFGMWQGNHVPGDSTGQAALSNGQIFVQKPDGKFQFFIEAGGYNMPAPCLPLLFSC